MAKLIRCPRCRGQVYEGTAICHHCESRIEARPRLVTTWGWISIAALVTVFVTIDSSVLLEDNMGRRARRLQIESRMRAVLLMSEDTRATQDVPENVIGPIRALGATFAEADLGSVVITGPFDERRGWARYRFEVDVVRPDGHRRLVGDLHFDRVADRICSLENLIWIF